MWHILARRGDYWCLASWDRAQRRGSIAVGKRMPRPGSFVSVNTIHDGCAVDSLDDLALFPELRYRGLKVYSEHWHPENAEPLLGCYMPTAALPGEPEEIWKARKQALIDEGWEDGGREGLRGYVHVDRLEKTEGPPPSGRK
jgi:hypothetical protein